MRTRVILVTMLMVMLVLTGTVNAQEVEPEIVVNDQAEAVNTGNVVRAEENTAETATVTAPQATTTEAAAPAPAEGESEDDDDDGDDPAAPAQATGPEATSAYYAGQVAVNANTTLGQCTTVGETVTCVATYTSDKLTAAGINQIEGQLVATVSGGKITSWDFTPSAASAEALRSAFTAPKTLPESGGSTPDTNYTVFVALGLLLLLAGAATYAFERRGV